MKTARPLEVFYFYLFSTQTKDKGIVYWTCVKGNLEIEI
jgi:hypothetical protein